MSAVRSEKDSATQDTGERKRGNCRWISAIDPRSRESVPGTMSGLPRGDASSNGSPAVLSATPED